MTDLFTCQAYVQKGENDICDDGKEIAEAEDWESTVNKIEVSENRVGIALQAVHPDYHRMRLNGASRSLNPQPYQAAYFGEKLHIDQNEKLVMFGVTPH
ncbi:hypothetical protein EMCRGX_G004960 [Ephydatia muelleri]